MILNLPNGVPDPGKYLIHITLLQDNGERLDAHMSFKAGGGQPTSAGSYGLYVLVLFAGLYIAYLSHAGFKRKVDQMIGKAKDF